MDFRAFRQRQFRRYDYDRTTRIAAAAGPRPDGCFDSSAAVARVPRNDRSGGGTGLGRRRRGLDESFAAHRGPVPSRMFAQGQSRPISYKIINFTGMDKNVVWDLLHFVVIMLSSADFNKTNPVKKIVQTQ